MSEHYPWKNCMGCRCQDQDPEAKIHAGSSGCRIDSEDRPDIKIARKEEVQVKKEVKSVLRPGVSEEGCQIEEIHTACGKDRRCCVMSQDTDWKRLRKPDKTARI